MKKIEKGKGLKLKRVDVITWSHNLAELDAFGATYPPRVAGRFTALDYHLQGLFDGGKKFYDNVRKEAIKALKKTETSEDPTEAQIEQYVSQHEEYNKFLQEDVVIPVEPIKIADLEGGNFKPTLFRPFYGTFIVM